MAARGHAGGLAPTSVAAATVLDAAGFDVVFIETVGTGQSEVEVAAAADTTVVLEAPEMGDEVQAIKAGLLEVADIVVVNKGDRPGRPADGEPAAGDARRDGAASPVGRVGRCRSGRRCCITTASTGAGVPELLAALDRRAPAREGPVAPTPRGSRAPTPRSGRSSPTGCSRALDAPSRRDGHATRAARRRGASARSRTRPRTSCSRRAGRRAPMAD